MKPLQAGLESSPAHMWPPGHNLPTSGLNGRIQAVSKPATGASADSALDTAVTPQGKQTRKMRNPEAQGKNSNRDTPVNPPFHVSGDAAPLSDLNADVMDQRAAIISALAFAACAV